MSAIALRVLPLLLVLATSACSKPEPPKKDEPPEPQAARSQPEQHTELRDSIQQPIDRAKAVEGQVLDAAKQQQDAIDAQTGG